MVEKHKQDHSTHYLLSLSEPPASLVALRDELKFHPEVTEYAIQGANFEECLGRIGVKLDVALDGEYDAEKLCALFVDLLRCTRIAVYSREAVLAKHGMVAAELVETKDGVQLEEHKTTVLEETDEVMVSEEAPKIVLH